MKKIIIALIILKMTPFAWASSDGYDMTHCKTFIEHDEYLNKYLRLTASNEIDQTYLKDKASYELNVDIKVDSKDYKLDEIMPSKGNVKKIKVYRKNKRIEKIEIKRDLSNASTIASEGNYITQIATITYVFNYKDNKCYPESGSQLGANTVVKKGKRKTKYTDYQLFNSGLCYSLSDFFKDKPKALNGDSAFEAEADELLSKYKSIPRISGELEDNSRLAKAIALNNDCQKDNRLKSTLNDNKIFTPSVEVVPANGVKPTTK